MAFFIQAEINNRTVTFELDATTSVDWVFSGSLTSNRVASGRDVADNYVDNNDIVTLSGLITDVSVSKSSNNTFSPQDYIDGLQSLKNDRQTFLITFSENLNSITNCLFESVSVSKTQTLGGDAWNIQFTAKQVRFVTQASIGLQPESSLQDLVSEKTTGPGSTNEPPEPKEEKLSETLRRVREELEAGF